jgi:hypothetical protein
MALLNYIKNGTYTVIGVGYSKIGKVLQIDLVTFSDSSKNLVLTKSNKYLNGSVPKQEIKGFSSSPPQSPSDLDAWVVGENPTGAWASKTPGKALIWVQDAQMWGDGPSTGEWYCSADGKYYQSNNNTWTENPAVFDSRVWDSVFSIENIGGADMNILKCTYNYLKSLPEFSECSDG